MVGETVVTLQMSYLRYAKCSKFKKITIPACATVYAHDQYDCNDFTGYGSKRL